jgi:hypothetical protein
LYVYNRRYVADGVYQPSRDGVDRSRNSYSELLRELDARQFAGAGFGVVKGKPTFTGPGMWYMYCEIDWGFHG